MLSQLRVAIIGAGLSGLTLAHGLHQKGIDVHIYEHDSSSSTRGQGYRLTIDPQGTHALKLCLPPRLSLLLNATRGQPGQRFTFYTIHKEVLHEQYFPTPPSGDDTIISGQVDRFTLRQILLADLDGQVHFGRHFSHFTWFPSEVSAQFQDGSSVTCDVLVGADGVHSRVRSQLLPDALVTDTGMRAIFGRTPLRKQGEQVIADDLLETGMVALGSQGQAFFCTSMRFRERPDVAAALLAPDLSLAPREDYSMWAVLFPQHLHEGIDHVTSEDRLQTIAEDLIADFHADFLRILKQSDISDTMLVPIRTSTPLKAWETRPVTLIGDAIHCMPPFGAHGANTALHDASLLAQALGQAFHGERDLLESIQSYERDMLLYASAAVQEAMQGMQQIRGSA